MYIQDADNPPNVDNARIHRSKPIPHNSTFRVERMHVPNDTYYQIFYDKDMWFGVSRRSTANKILQLYNLGYRRTFK